MVCLEHTFKVSILSISYEVTFQNVCLVFSGWLLPFCLKPVAVKAFLLFVGRGSFFFLLCDGYAQPLTHGSQFNGWPPHFLQLDETILNHDRCMISSVILSCPYTKSCIASMNLCEWSSFLGVLTPFFQPWTKTACRGHLEFDLYQLLRTEPLP